MADPSKKPQAYKRQREITIKDVAARSGVSAATVSRVLSNSGYPVSRQVRQRVAEAARALGYTASLTRSGTRSGREIAVLVPTVANPFFPAVITGIESVVVKEGFSLLLYNTNTGCAAGTGEQLLRGVVDKRVAGIVIASPSLYPACADQVAEAADRGIRVVLADCPSPDQRFNSVFYDYEKGSLLGTEYLIERGHRDILYAGLELERESRLLRVQGFCKAMQARSLPYGDDRILLLDGAEAAESNQAQCGEELARRILARRDRPTAVAVINDMVALGMLRFFLSHGVRVPEDISVLGFDDSVFCEMAYPALTTVKVQAEQMGRMAAMLLLEDLREGGKAAVGLSLEPCVVERDSVGPCPRK